MILADPPLQIRFELRPLGRRILQAGEEGYVEAHIIFPGGIVGEAHGPVLVGSTFLKILIQLATERQRAFYFGEGTNMFLLGTSYGPTRFLT